MTSVYLKRLCDIRVCGCSLKKLANAFHNFLGNIWRKCKHLWKYLVKLLFFWKCLEHFVVARNIASDRTIILSGCGFHKAALIVWLAGSHFGGNLFFVLIWTKSAYVATRWRNTGSSAVRWSPPEITRPQMVFSTNFYIFENHDKLSYLP